MVGIVVVTYNRLLLLKENIESLREQTYTDYKIIVVNNGSTDGTEEWLMSQKDLIVLNQENLGGAGGFHTGIKYAVQSGFDYIWLMDDDTIPTKNALDNMFQKVQLLAKNSWGFLCSRVVDLTDNSSNVPEIDMRKWGRAYPNWDEKIDSKMVKIRYATFVSVLIPVENIKEYGLPIKDFFIWGDDTEYTYRLSTKLPCYLVGDSLVLHKRENGEGLPFLQETNNNRLKLYFYMYRNQLILYREGIFGIRFCVLRYYLSKIFLLLKCLLRCKFFHAKVLVIALIKAAFFKPSIEYIH